MSEDPEALYMSSLTKQLSPNVVVQARITSVGDVPDIEPVAGTLYAIERAILNGLKKNDHFLNVEAVSSETGEPIYNFAKKPAPGDPVLETAVLVVSLKTIQSLESTSVAVQAPRVYASERLGDDMRYVDDGLNEEDSLYVFL